MSQVEFFEEEDSSPASSPDQKQFSAANLLLRHGVVQNERQGRAVIAGCLFALVASVFITFTTVRSDKPVSGTTNTRIPPDETRL